MALFDNSSPADSDEDDEDTDASGWAAGADAENATSAESKSCRANGIAFSIPSIPFASSTTWRADGDEDEVNDDDECSSAEAAEDATADGCRFFAGG